MSDWNKFKKAHYGSKTLITSSYGMINFDPDSIKNIVGGDKLNYDEYLDIQKASNDNIRHSFERCYYEVPMAFKGEIERRSRGKICFKRIFVEGMYPDGLMFDGSEDHVWMDECGFESFTVGDCVSFGAEVYRYLKTGNGKRIDYALRKPQSITKISSYDLPSDDEINAQYLEIINCEGCSISDQCAGMDYCIKSNRSFR